MEDPAANQSRAESGGKGQVIDLEASTQGEQYDKLPGVGSGRSRRSELRAAGRARTGVSRRLEFSSLHGRCIRPESRVGALPALRQSSLKPPLSVDPEGAFLGSVVLHSVGRSQNLL